QWVIERQLAPCAPPDCELPLGQLEVVVQIAQTEAHDARLKPALPSRRAHRQALPGMKLSRWSRPLLGELRQISATLSEAAAHLLEASQRVEAGLGGRARLAREVLEQRIECRTHDAAVLSDDLAHPLDEVDRRDAIDAAIRVEHPQGPRGIVGGERRR